MTGLGPEKAADNRCEALKTARADPKLILPRGSDPKAFRLSLVLPLGAQRGIGRGGFSTSIHDAVDVFYRDVMQGIRPWVPPPPTLPARDAATAEDQPGASDELSSSV